MKAVLFDRYGTPDVLQYRDCDRPVPTGDRVLVRVAASSVNPVDWKIRRGDLALLSGFEFPKSLGCDVAGWVEEIGDDVTQFQPGDAVFGFTDPVSGGTYAEYALLPQHHLAPKPDHLDFVEAAAAALAGVTAIQSLLDLGELRPGFSVFVNGASGGVGSLAVQIAKAFDATVAGSCSAANLDLVRGLGADRVVDYRETDFTREEAQYDLIFDAVGKQSFFNCTRVLAPSGTYVSTLPSAELFAAIAQTFFLPGQSAKLVVTEPKRRDLQSLAELLTTEKVRVALDRTYPLAEMEAAHRYSQTERAAGKIAIVVSS